MNTSEISHFHNDIMLLLNLQFQSAGEDFDASEFFAQLTKHDSVENPSVVSLASEALENLQEHLISRLLNRDSLENSHPKLYRYLNHVLHQTWNQQLQTNSYSTTYLSLVNFLSRILSPYDEEGGKSFARTLDRFTETLQHLLEKPVKIIDLDKLTNQLMFEYKQFLERTRNLEARMVQFERQSVLNRSASDQAIELIDREVEGHTVPSWFYEFIYEYWQRFFHLHILKEGADSPSIKNGLSILGSLVNLVSLSSPGEMKETFSSTFIKLQKDISQLLATIVVEESVANRFIEQIEEECLDTISGSTDRKDWIEIESKSKSNNKAQVDFGEDLGKLKVGQWYRWSRDGQVLNVRVLDINLEHDFILLVNYSGARVASLSSEKLHYELSSGQLTTLDVNEKFSIVCDAFNKKLKYAIEELQKELSLRSAEELKKRVKERVAQSQAQRLKVKEERSKSIQRALERQIAKQREKALSETYDLLSTLSLGATFIQHQPKNRIVQFAVRLRNNQQMLLVDEKGVRVAQWTIAEFAEKIVDGDFELIANQSSSDTIMQSIVQQQRRRRQQQSGEPQ